MKKLIFAPVAPKPAHVERWSRPVATFVLALKTFCWSSACHIAGPVVPAQATNSRSAFACFACCANGVKSFAVSGTRIFETLCPLPPMIAETAATLPCPNAESCAKTTIFRPTPLPSSDCAASTSCQLWRPERNVYLLTPVMASDAAGPEMNSTWFRAAIGATWSATPDEVEPARIL